MKKKFYRIGHNVLLCLLVVAFSSVSKSFAQIANGKCKFLGNVYSSNTPANFPNYWNQVTPENDGKWGSVEKTQDNMTWGGLDAAYNFAKNHNFIFKQHNFVWGQQQPAWIDALSPADQKAEVEEWIQEYGARYPNTDFIDVVNEPFHAVPSYMNAIGGAGTTGWDWVVWTFEKARQYCPNAKLLINEYNVINDNTATNNYIQLINILKDKSLLDGIGVQGHYFELGATSTDVLKANLTKLGATGLPVYISEYEVEEVDDSKQLAKYQDQFAALWSHKAVNGITLWGYTPTMWKANGYLVGSDGTERPALQWLKQTIPAMSVTCMSTGLTTGVSAEEEGSLIVYPNPVTNHVLVVTFSDPIASFKIITSTGTMVRQGTLKKQASPAKIEIDLSPGIYLVQFQQENGGVHYRKIAVQ